MNWIGYAKTGREQAVSQEISDLGIECHCPMRMEFIRRGKKRKPEPVVSPFLPNSLFIRGSASDFHKLSTVRGLSATLMAFPDASWVRYVEPFLAATASEYRRAEELAASGQRVEQFRAGQALSIIAGPFMDQIVRFIGTVEKADALHPVIVGEFDVMGQATRISLDPLNVKAAE